MRKRGIHIKAGFVLMGILLVFTMSGCQFHENDPYNESHGSPVYGGSADEIGQRWTEEKEAQVNELHEKMNHDLDLTPIE